MSQYQSSLNLSAHHDNAGTRVVAFLDAEKALDSVEWLYLWEVLCRFRFGPKFLQWLGMLYRTPHARVRKNYYYLCSSL